MRVGWKTRGPGFDSRRLHLCVIGDAATGMRRSRRASLYCAALRTVRLDSRRLHRLDASFLGRLSRGVTLWRHRVDDAALSVAVIVRAGGCSRFLLGAFGDDGFGGEH